MKLGSLEVTSKGLHVSRVSHAKDTAAPQAVEVRPSDVDTREIGSSGTSYYGRIAPHEYAPELRGHRGIETFQKMRRADPTVRSSLLLLKAPVLSAQWYMEPYSDSPEDREVAEFIEWNLNNLHRPFIEFLWEALFCLDYGHYVFEKVFEITTWTPNRKGAHTRVVAKWKDFAPRHPLTLSEEGPERDANGRPSGWWHTPNNKLGDRKLLEWQKLLCFSWDKEGDDVRGVSVLRSAHMSHYFKINLYKVDAIQKERHGIGIPDIELPPGFKPKDKIKANELGRNLRTNEKAHVTRPPGWKVGFIELQGQPVDALESAIHHNGEIMRNVLMQFAESTTRTSNSKEGDSNVDIMFKALRSLADLMRGRINHDAIPELVDKNFKVQGYPQLKVRRIAENAEFRALAVALRNLGESGYVTPTSEMEEYILETADFPKPSDEAMKRSVKDRITKGGTRGGAAANQNRSDAGNEDDGESPSGNPTE